MRGPPETASSGLLTAAESAEFLALAERSALVHCTNFDVREGRWVEVTT